jgi:archaemetzincin
LLERVLPRRLPADGAALIALTTADLWGKDPAGKPMNFVFGQASTVDRVGVWSIERFGDLTNGPTDFNKCLLRTCKTAAHETGHMFSIPHCTAFECNLRGTMGLAEMDRIPLECCPECLAKLCWATGADPSRRFAQLAEFCRKHGFLDELDHYEKSI